VSSSGKAFCNITQSKSTSELLSRHIISAESVRGADNLEEAHSLALKIKCCSLLNQSIGSHFKVASRQKSSLTNGRFYMVARNSYWPSIQIGNVN